VFKSSILHRPWFRTFAERGRNRSRSHVFTILDILTRSGNIRDHSPKLSEIDPNLTEGKVFLGKDSRIFGRTIRYDRRD